ncbi:MAG: metallophosphoesterase family protein [Hyphomicrobiaceae bacterium]
MTFRLAHLSDPHLHPFPVPTWREWNLKRVLGSLNWHRGRKRQHRMDVLQRLLADLVAREPDHIAVTGDLANLGLPVEHQGALAWLRSIGSPAMVSVVPGNHDIFTESHGPAGVECWRDYMTGDDDPAGEEASPFPFVRRLGRVVLIGLNSAVPAPPLRGWGLLGDAQRQRLAAILRSSAQENLVRVVLIHHPPAPGLRDRSYALNDAAELAEVLRREGAELVLHGHNHRAMLNVTPGPTRPVPLIGAPSASLGETHGNQTLARYNLFEIGDEPGIMHIEMIERGITSADGAVEEIARHQLPFVRAETAPQ